MRLSVWLLRPWFVEEFLRTRLIALGIAKILLVVLALGFFTSTTASAQISCGSRQINDANNRGSGFSGVIRMDVSDQVGGGVGRNCIGTRSIIPPTRILFCSGNTRDCVFIQLPISSQVERATSPTDNVRLNIYAYQRNTRTAVDLVADGVCQPLGSGGTKPTLQINDRTGVRCNVQATYRTSEGDAVIRFRARRIEDLYLIEDVTAVGGAFGGSMPSDPPTVTIDGAPAATNAPFAVSMTFSENVTGFAASDVVVGNGDATAFAQVSGSLYTAIITPSASGNVTVDVPAGVARDGNGDGNIAAAQVVTAFETAAPAVVMSSPSGTTVAGPFTLNLQFSEPVNEVSLNDFVTHNATITDRSGSGSSYSFRVIPKYDGALTIDYLQGEAVDAAGNGNTAARFTATVSGFAPTPPVSGSDGCTGLAERLGGIYAQADSWFAAREFALNRPFNAGDTLQIRTIEGSGTIQAGIHRPGRPGDRPEGILDGELGTSVVLGVTADYRSVTASFGAGTLRVIIATCSPGSVDTSPPAVAISGVPENTNRPFTVTITFSENVTGFDASDLSIGNGTVTSFSAQSGSVYAATITPAGDGNVTVGIAAGAAQDAADNQSNASATATAAFDATLPTVAISGVPATSDMAFTATFTFSEPVTGFSPGDIRIENGLVSGFTAVSGSVYTASINPTSDGVVKIDVPGGVAADAASNSNTAAAQATSLFDRSAPSVVISGVPAVSAGPFVATFTFSEDVTGFVATDIALTNATLSDFVAVNSSSYRATVAPTADGLVTLNIGSAAAQDRVGNDNTAATEARSNFSANAIQAVSFKRLLPATSLTNANTLAFEVTFGVPMQSVSISDFRVTGTTANVNAVAEINNAAGIFRFTASGGDLTSLNGVVGLDLAAGQTLRTALGHRVASQEPGIDETYTLENVLPNVISVRRQQPSTSPTNATSLTWRVEFSEPVFTVRPRYFSYSGTTAGTANVVAVDGRTFDVTASGGDLASISGTIGLFLSGDARDELMDAAGNPLGVTVPTINEAFVVDRTRPIVTLSGVPATANGSFTLTLMFSEDVTGLELSDFVVANGSASDLQQLSGRSYTVLITPTRDGVVSVALPEGAAKSAAGNLSAAVGGTATTFDGTRPAVAISGVPAQSATPFVATFNFSENVTGFDLADISLSNGTASGFKVVSGSLYRALITPSGGGNTVIQIAAGVAQDALGNLNTAAAVVEILFDVSPPTVRIKAPSPVRAAFTATITFSEDVTGFTATDILVGNGRVRGLSGGPAAYEALIVPISSGGPTTDVTLVVAADVAEDTAGNGNLVSERVVVTFIDEELIRRRTGAIITNFISHRADQITANDPDLSGRLSGAAPGGGGPQSSIGGVALTAEGVPSEERIVVAGGLRQILSVGEAQRASERRKLVERMALGGAHQLKRPLAATGWDMWLKTTWLRASAATTKNEMSLAHLGIDYRLSPDLLIGAMLQYDEIAQNGYKDGFSISGQGWMVGPYIVTALTPQTLLEGKIAWGQSSNSVSPFDTYSDTFTTQRLMSKVRLSGRFDMGAWRFSPHTELLYFREESKSYTDSLDVSIPSQASELGRLTFGPGLSHAISAFPGLTISSHVSLRGIWDFAVTRDVDLATGLTRGGQQGLRGRLEAGLRAQLPSRLKLNVEGFYDGIGQKQFESYGGSLNVTIPLQ